MSHFIARLIINAVALAVAANIVPGIHIAGNDTASIINILIVAFIFGVINAVIKPLLALVTCPFYIFTLGLFTFVVNALMLMLTGWVAGDIFRVSGFMPAFWGSIVISIISTVLSVFLIDDKKK